MLRWAVDIAATVVVVAGEAAVLTAILAVATAFEVVDAMTWVRDERAARRRA